MQINRINNFATFKGYDPYVAAQTPRLTQRHYEDFGVPVTFRDEELFDPEVDVVDNGYKIYSYDDVQLYKPVRDSQLKKCHEFFGITDRIKVDIDTNPILGYVVVGGRDIEENEAVMRSPILTESAQPFIDACRLRVKGGRAEVSQPLFMKLKAYKDKTDCSYMEVISIARDSKLKNKNKSEYVEPKMIDAAIYCHENFPHRSGAVMNSMIFHDENGNQIFSSDAFDFLVGAKIFATNKATLMLSVLTYEDKSGVEKFNTELSKKILEYRKKNYSIERIEAIIDMAYAINSADNSRINPELVDSIDVCMDTYFFNTKPLLMSMQERDERGKTSLSKDAYDFVMNSGLRSGYIAEKIVRKSMLKGENNTRTFDRDCAEQLLAEYSKNVTGL